MYKLNLYKEIYTKLRDYDFQKINQNTFIYVKDGIFCFVFNIQPDRKSKERFTFNFSITPLIVPQFKEKPGISLKPGARLNYFINERKHWWEFSEFNEFKNREVFDEIFFLIENNLIPWYSANSNVNSLIDINLNKPLLYSPSLDWKYIELFHFYLYSNNFDAAEDVLFELNNIYIDLLSFMKDWLNNLKNIDYKSKNYLLSIVNENRVGLNLLKLNQLPC